MGSHPVSALVTACVLVGLLGACAPEQDLLTSHTGPASTPGSSYAAFVPNPGLGEASILYETLGASASALFARHEVLFPAPCATQSVAVFDRLLAGDSSTPPATQAPSLLRLEFLRASDATRVVGAQSLPGVVSYYLGDDPAAWREDTPTYGSIVYKELYPGVDLTYQGSDVGLKGTFTLAPGADPDAIRWRYVGAARVQAHDGELLVYRDETGAPTLVEHRPVAWQLVDGRSVAVRVRYRIQRDGSVGLVLGRYRAGYPLVIDPTIDYATYWGTRYCEAAYGLATDDQSNVYITGPTNAPFYSTPPTSCAVDDRTDIFVTKLDPSQSGPNQHIYTTYIGGGGYDLVISIGVDGSGRACLSGYSGSIDLPTTANAYQRTAPGSMNGMVAQLGVGGRVRYLTYLGGDSFDEQAQCAVTRAGLVCVSGFTDSANFPTTANAFSHTLSGHRDAFIALLDPGQSGVASLVYSTYFGGQAVDEGYGVAVSNDVIYLAGVTLSTDLPTKHPTQATFGGGGGYGDVFVGKLDPSLPPNDQLLFATYYGGSGMEWSSWIAADGAGHLYLVGATASTDLPVTATSPAYAGGNYDAMAAKWDTEPAALVYSRFIGGSATDGLRSPAVDRNGSLYGVGLTGSPNLPTVAAVQPTFGGGASPDIFQHLGALDALVVKLDSAGALVFCSYLGGSGAEGAMGVSVGADGRVYVGMPTRSTDVDTEDALQTANAGTWDAYVVALGGLAPPPLVFLPIAQR